MDKIKAMLDTIKALAVLHKVGKEEGELVMRFTEEDYTLEELFSEEMLKEAPCMDTYNGDLLAYYEDMGWVLEYAEDMVQ